jgi:hypothetical protein
LMNRKQLASFSHLLIAILYINKGAAINIHLFRIKISDPRLVPPVWYPAAKTWFRVSKIIQGAEQRLHLLVVWQRVKDFDFSRGATAFSVPLLSSLGFYFYLLL